MTAYPLLDDDVAASDLLLLMRAGSPQATTAFYARHEPAVRRFARRLVAPSDVDDLVAEVFTKVLHAIRTGHGPRDHPERYLSVAARTTAASVHRARARASEADRCSSPVDISFDDHSWDFDQRLLDAVSTLTPRAQQAIWWSTVEGLSPTEVGARIGTTSNAAAALCCRSRQALRRAYDELGGPGRGA